MPRRKQPLRKAVFLVPVADNQGVPFNHEDIGWLEGELIARFGGWHTDEVEGAWRGPDSRIYREGMKRYHVAISGQQRQAMRRFLAAVRRRFRQEAIYVEWRDAEVEIIE